jgi:uncharacterized HAD superfamily protein
MSSKLRGFVGFDLDGVLATHQRMAEAVGKEIGRPVSYQDWSHYDYYQTYGITSQRFCELLIEERVLENAIPMPLARQAIDDLHERGLRVAICTARAFHPRGEAMTREWLEEHGLRYDRLTLVHHGETKAHALTSNGPLVSYVDDYLDHLADLTIAKVPIPLFVMDQPWNRPNDNFRRVHSVQEYVEQADLLARARLAAAMVPAEGAAMTAHETSRTVVVAAPR